MDKINGVNPNKVAAENFLPKSKPGDIYIIGNSNNFEITKNDIQRDDAIVLFNSINDTIFIKPDILFVANSSGMILDNEVLNNYKKLTNLSLVVWRYHTYDILFSRYENVSFSKKIKYLLRFRKFRRKNRLDTINQTIIPQNIHNKCIKLLNNEIPSTGFLAIILYLTLYPERSIYVHNFNFVGWEGHNWHMERKYIEQLATDGLIKLIKS